MLENADRVLRLPDIAVGDHRDGHSLLHRPNAGPVRLTAVHLGPGPAVDRHGGGPCLLQDSGELHAVAAAHVPAPAELGGHRHRDGFHHCLHDASGLFRVLHQGGSVAVVDDLAHGAAHVQVHHIRPGMLQGDLGCLCHADRVTAEDLHCRRVLPGKLLEQGQGLLVVVAQGLGGDELRDGISRPQFRADLAEGDVRDPGHGGQGQGGVDGKRADVQGGPSFPMKT